MIVQNPVVIDEDTLKRMARAVRGGIHHIYLHWTAGHYGQVYDDYHLCIDRDGKHDINDTMLFADISLKNNSNIIIMEGFLTPRGCSEGHIFY